MFAIVTIKLIEPAIDEVPARCRAKIAKSTAAPQCPNFEDSGGYKVQPVPGPTSDVQDSNRNNKANGISQKLKLFSLGKAISGAPIKVGTK